jgi:hypothetical protein
MRWLFIILVAVQVQAKDFKSQFNETLKFSRQERILKATAFFVGSASGLDPLGDGVGLDPKVTYSLAKFDCTTYVETVLAISHSKSMDEIPKQLTRIRYQNGQVDFFKRNHFMVSDWIPANTQQGFVSEITAKLSDDKAAYLTDKRLLNKTFWFYHRVIDLMDKQQKSAEEILIQLSKVPVLPRQEDHATYLSADYFREHTGEIKTRLPTVSIVMFIRKIQNIPTLVSHMGFLIQKEGQLYLNHAPQAKPWMIQEELLDDYLKSMDAHRAPVEGLLVLKIVYGN